MKTPYTLEKAIKKVKKVELNPNLSLTAIVATEDDSFFVVTEHGNAQATTYWVVNKETHKVYAFPVSDLYTVAEDIRLIGVGRVKKTTAASTAAAHIIIA